MTFAIIYLVIGALVTLYMICDWLKRPWNELGLTELSVCMFAGIVWPFTVAVLIHER